MKGIVSEGGSLYGVAAVMEEGSLEEREGVKGEEAVETEVQE